MPFEERDETLPVMENPARNDCMLHNQELKSKGENHNGVSKIPTQ
jgi:hypothetical protein